MNQETFQNSLDKQKSLINNCKDLLNGLGDNFSCGDLDEIVQELSVIVKSHGRSLAALEAMPAPGPNNKEDTEELYKLALESLPIKDSSDSEAEDDEIDISNMNASIVFSQCGGIPTDPITQNRIKTPARNKICNHVYENNIILAYLEQAKKSQNKKKKVKCPYIGCTNDNILVEQIVKDEQLKQRIRMLMDNETNNEQNISNIVDL